MRVPSTLLALAAFALLAAACGVQFSTPARTNQFFQSLTVTGELRTGAPLTASLAYQQNLPVNIDVQCETRQGTRLIKPLGHDTIPQYPQGSPKLTPIPGNASFAFTVDAPGDYKAECYTPVDQDVYIIKTFTVRGPALTPTASP
ncbi:MAG: hypothetical protein ACYDCT_13240 [Dehalococcoidia bacterium]